MLAKRLSKLLFKYFSIFLLLLINSCSNSNFYEHKVLIYGTILEFKFYDTNLDQANQAIDQIVDKLNDLNKKFHPWEKSLISEFNQTHQINNCDQEFIKIIEIAKNYENVTHSQFNPAIGKLIEIWGFHENVIKGQVPDEEDINKILQTQPSLNQLLLTDHTISTDNTSLKIDLGGMIKGLALDIAKQTYQDMGIKNVLTNFGGNIYAHGKPDKRLWEVAIQNPHNNKLLLAKLKMQPGSAIGTSGDYEKYFIHNHQKYSHLINPKNGQAFSLYSSATVLINPNENDVGIKSDVFSKPLYFSENLVETSKSLQLNHFFTTDHNNHIFISKSFADEIIWLFNEGDFIVEVI